jgi:integrating conjugative element protein (TIGR03759 family)
MVKGSYIFHILVFTCCVSLSPISAETVPQQLKKTDIAGRQTDNTQTMASRFELTSDDWSRYEEIMAGEGKYHWSNVDPVWVLSIYAETESERQRFARLAARQEYERTSKLLKFKDAYVDAFWQMYGDEPIIDLASFQQRYDQRKVNSSISTSSKDLQPIKQQSNFNGDRLVLFMTTNCNHCDQVFTQLSQHQADIPGAALDIHFIGDNEQTISSWANRMGIDPSDISRGYITLNQNSEMYAKYGNPALPAAFYFDASTNSVKPIAEDAQ